MENYVKTEKEEEFVPELTIEGTKEGALVMHVKPGSKIKNLMQFADKKLASDSSGQILWSGSGDAVQKTITCAEIMKKKSNYSLHQITRLTSMRIVETWTPRLDGLDAIRVNRQLPLVKILLSKDALNVDANGYQAPDDSQGLFSRGQGGGRPKTNKPNQRTQQKRSKSSKTEGCDDQSETLLADTNRRKGREKSMKEEKKKKKAAGKPADSKKQSTDGNPANKTPADAKQQQCAKQQEASPDSNSDKKDGATSAKSEISQSAKASPQSVDSPSSGLVGGETVDENGGNRPESMDVDG